MEVICFKQYLLYHLEQVHVIKHANKFAVMSVSHTFRVYCVVDIEGGGN